MAICWAMVVAFWLAAAFWVKPTKQKPRFTGRIVYLVLVALALLLFKGAFRKPQLGRTILPHTVTMGILADFLVLLGLIVALWARTALGRNWSGRVTLKEDHELIQTGPYRVVRHPIYSGLLLMILGTVILAGQLGGLVAFVICFSGFWVKLKLEERLMSKQFPGAYREYMARTKALIPFIL